ncbi:ATP-binding protein [Streptomyces sp. TLI_171]|uniref:ATP-binding protein n=1 Tax=Streptomyces sp. TLI_171 TaxID=1938859 RepID=UPI000C1781A4|nr:ATP-binding protein [Streptomyces sp. TLI_171]RKE17355.1 anti-sigma regulatory factor (Ser/Thr protein kinase) [Streptomyces sp. TLI_171]
MPHDEARPPSPEVRLPAGPAPRATATVRTAGQARAVVARLLADAGHPGGRVLAEAQLAVTELVANALRHGGGGLTWFDARLDLAGTRLVVDVEDADDRHPVVQPLQGRDPAAPGGRGWAIVRALAVSCQVEQLPVGGKRIRAVFAL